MTDRPTFAGKSSYFLIAFLVLVLDQWSKWLVEEKISAATTVEVIPGLLNFVHVTNTGVAFGLFASHGDRAGTLLLAALGSLALTFVVYYFYLTPLWDRLLLFSLGLVMGGAVGNLIDRLAQGGVTDFIDFYVGSYHWHTFNIADSAITVGIALLLISSFRRPPDAADDEDETPAAEGEPSVGDGDGDGETAHEAGRDARPAAG